MLEWIRFNFLFRVVHYLIISMILIVCDSLWTLPSAIIGIDSPRVINIRGGNAHSVLNIKSSMFELLREISQVASITIYIIHRGQPDILKI